MSGLSRSLASSPSPLTKLRPGSFQIRAFSLQTCNASTAFFAMFIAPATVFALRALKHDPNDTSLLNKTYWGKPQVLLIPIGHGLAWVSSIPGTRGLQARTRCSGHWIPMIGSVGTVPQSPSVDPGQASRAGFSNTVMSPKPLTISRNRVLACQSLVDRPL